MLRPSGKGCKVCGGAKVILLLSVMVFDTICIASGRHRLTRSRGKGQVLREGKRKRKGGARGVRVRANR